MLFAKDLFLDLFKAPLIRRQFVDATKRISKCPGHFGGGAIGEKPPALEKAVPEADAEKELSLNLRIRRKNLGYGSPPH